MRPSPSCLLACALFAAACTAAPRKSDPPTTADSNLASVSHRRAPDSGSAAPGARSSQVAGLPDGWPFLGQRPVVAPHGMVATDAPLATHVGVGVLRAGGNAIDAAVATAFALAVVLPDAGNIGGGGFIVAHLADGREGALDFREAAPGKATRNMYLGANGHADDRSVTGDLAAGVPGSVAGLFEAHRKLGTKPWAELLAPAIVLADSGFVVDDDFARSVRGDSARLSRFPASAALFLPGRHPLRAGDRWRNPELAAVLRRIAKDGPDGFYRGATADLIVAQMKRGGGIITHQDLTGYRAKWRDPVVFEYRGHRVVSMPLPSSGGITMAIAAKELSKRDLVAMGWHSPQGIHLETEAFRRAFAVRNSMLGDPDFVRVDVAALTSSGFADSLAESISPDHATRSSDVHVPVGAAVEGRHTTHFSVIDGQGGAVALTTTINTGYGSASVVQGGGFLLNDEMDDFATEPGSPNVYGLVQGEANAIAPGKRMLSSMSPTIVFGDDGTPLLVTGASGGPTIISTAFQITSNVVDFGMDIAQAVSAPRLHHQHLPDTLFMDRGGFMPATVSALGQMGHRISFWPVGDIGIGASLLRRGGHVYGSSDPRIHGSAEGY